MRLICLLAVLAVSGASDHAVIIGQQLPLGHTFGDLGWGNTQTVLPRNNGWGWGHSLPSYSHSYSYFNGGGWPSTPVYKDVPITYNAGWGKEVAVPITYNAGWGNEISTVPITYNAGWGKQVPVPITYNPGWGKQVQVPVTYNAGWGKQVHVPVTYSAGWEKPVHVPVTYSAGWEKPVHVPVAYNAGWGKEAQLIYNYGWNTPTYGYGHSTFHGKANGWGQQSFPLLTKSFVGVNGWGQTAAPVVAIKSVGQGIPLLKGGWADSRYAGGWPSTPALQYYK